MTPFHEAGQAAFLVLEQSILTDCSLAKCITAPRLWYGYLDVLPQKLYPRDV